MHYSFARGNEGEAGNSKMARLLKMGELRDKTPETPS